MSKRRPGVAVALVILVTAILAGAVATSAAIATELGDGDTCETGGTSYVRLTPTAENVRTLAGNVTKCVAEGGGTDVVPGGPPSETDRTSDPGRSR